MFCFRLHIVFIACCPQNWWSACLGSGSSNRGYTCCRGSLESRVAAQGYRDGIGSQMLSYRAGAPPVPRHLCPVLTAGLLLVAGLSLLSTPTSVAKDVPQTWHTLPLHQLWPPGLARWHTGLFTGDLLKGDRRVEIVSCIWMRSFAFLEKKKKCIFSPFLSFCTPYFTLRLFAFFPFQAISFFWKEEKVAL